MEKAIWDPILMEMVQQKQAEPFEKKERVAGTPEQQEQRQRVGGEMVPQEINFPWTLHPPAREGGGVGVLLTAGVRRRWWDKENSINEEYPEVTGSSGKLEFIAYGVKQTEHRDCNRYVARGNGDYYNHGGRENSLPLPRPWKHMPQVETISLAWTSAKKSEREENMENMVDQHSKQVAYSISTKEKQNKTSLSPPLQYSLSETNHDEHISISDAYSGLLRASYMKSSVPLFTGRGFD